MDIKDVLATIEQEIKRALPNVVKLRNERTAKVDSSYVTQGDLYINRIIEDIVNRTSEKISIVSEEKIVPIAEKQDGYVFVVDPIDGTENFTSGLPEWGVSISCFRDGHHVASLLGCPEMNIWIRSGDTIPVFYSRIRGLSSSLQKDELIKATHGYEYRILGCCVYNMINVIRGSFLSFENPKGAHSWDILGGLNLALENKLKVIVNDKEYKGEYLSADQKYRFWVGR